MLLSETVRTHGGVVRQSELTALGVAKRSIAAAVSGGHLIRIHRSWLATPDADPLLILAAQAGVVLSCVTVARRRGLWVLDVDRPHAAAGGHAGGVELGTMKVHWHQPIVPRAPHHLEDSIENALVLVALCQPHEQALAVWESALNKRLIDRQVMEGLPLPLKARQILEAARPYSDSGLETLVPSRLRWLRVRIIPQAWVEGHRVDFLIGRRLVLQIDGAHHVGRQREEDIRHDAELLLRGYHVIRIGYWQIVQDWPGVQSLVMQAVAQGLHLVR